MLKTVLDYISGTNLFNFIIFASILAYCYIKLDVTGGLDKAKDEVKEGIEHSENLKQESKENLTKIETKVSHLQDEIDEIIKASVENANLVGEKVLSDAEKTADSIKENAKKNIENKISLMRNDIMKRASQASILAAKDHIVNELNNNYDLHLKLIDDSVDAISGVEL